MANLGEPPPGDDVMELHGLLPRAGLILPDAIRRHAEGAHALARGRGAKLRIAGDVSEDKGLVEIHE